MKKQTEFQTMSLNELSILHDRVTEILTSKLNAEKRLLEKRLALLQPRDSGVSKAASARRARRYYPEVLPKYRNPANPSETWAGRGKQPRWLTAQLRSGKRIEHFLIDPTGRKIQSKRVAR
jgi:DNA-binding protein H-NS